MTSSPRTTSGIYGISPQTTKRGQCSRCERVVRLRNDGTVSAHRTLMGGLTLTRYCAGGGEPPKAKP